MNTIILKDLKDTTRSLMETLSSFSPAKFNAIPFEGSWTAAQVGDHLLKSYGLVEILNSDVKETERPYDQMVEGIKGNFLNFGIKMQSPEFIIPSQGVINKEALLSSIEHRIAQMIRITETEDLSMTCMAFVIPQMGEMTRFEWIYFLIYHTQRHLKQLQNISALLDNVSA